MTDFHRTFPKGRVVLPVIHVQGGEQALRNAQTAFEAGADGVFLISMEGMGSGGVLRIQREVRRAFPGWWIGVNLLGETPASAFPLLDGGVSGLWADNAGIDERAALQPVADAVRAARVNSGWKGLYFGGVAFKYQRRVENPALAARIAAGYVDAITTSGEGTGLAPGVGKIAAMKAAVPDFPIAIASGISPENAADYRDFADCFLVATSLLKPGTEDFDPNRVRALVRAVKG